MAVIKFKQRDRNRYRKVYPYLIRKPIYELVSSGNAQIDIGYIDFSGLGPTQKFQFGTPFITVPIVTLTAVRSNPHIDANVNVYIENITTIEVTVSISDPNFIGRVHIHAIAAV